jgi:hypothetical protein
VGLLEDEDDPAGVGLDDPDAADGRVDLVVVEGVLGQGLLGERGNVDVADVARGLGASP